MLVSLVKLRCPRSFRGWRLPKSAMRHYLEHPFWQACAGGEAKFYLHILQAAVEDSREAAELDEDVGIRTCDLIFNSASFEQKVVL